MKKLKNNNNNHKNSKNKKESYKEAIMAVKGIKPLSKPLFGKFLSLVIKHEVMKKSEKEEVEE